MKSAGLAAVGRVVIGLAAGALVMGVVGLLVWPSLVFSSRPDYGPAPAAESSAKALAIRLEGAMSDQEIANAVSFTGSNVVDVRRSDGGATVLVSIPDSVVQPTGFECFEFVLSSGEDVSYTRSPSCPMLAPTTT